MRPADDLASDILRTIRQVVRQISIHSKHLLRDVGLSVPQVVCLRAIDETAVGAEGVTVAEVSERVQLSPATVSRIVDRLVVAGLITRERSAADRRKVSIALTEAGHAQLRDLPTPLQETFLRRLGELPLDERTRLRDALRRVAELMSADDLDAAPLLAPGDEVNPGPAGGRG